MQRLLDVNMGTKIAGGFAMILTLLAIVSGVGFGSLSLVVNNWNRADSADHLVKTILEARRHEKNFQLRGDLNYVKKVDELVADFKNTAEQVAVQASSQSHKEAMNQALQELGKYAAAFHNYVDAKLKQDGAVSNTGAKAQAALEETEVTVADRNMINAARAIQAVCDKARLECKKEMEDNTRLTKLIIMGFAGIGLLLGIVMAFLLTRGIVGPIRSVIEGLSRGAEQVGTAAGQIAGTSQHLAEGASQQASSLEETSSSLEQMSSMTKQNAGNADQANALMTETRNTVSEAGASMNQLMASMSEISKASEETSKIIKTIDEIAFQTNLLALNAAVEAARAGEAGAGFAVVADEVRNLAVRAADAARSTADLIRATVVKTSEGSAVVEKTSQGFSMVTSSAVKMAELVGEIAAASGEQAQGIEQISKAVNAMDNVVQDNAANAEESASASEEMSAQAEQMKAFVARLEHMVGGSGKAFNNKMKKKAGGDRSGLSARRAQPRDAKPAALRNPAGSRAPGKADGGRANEAFVPNHKRVNPEQVIPLEDKEFDF